MYFLETLFWLNGYVKKQTVYVRRNGLTKDLFSVIIVICSGLQKPEETMFRLSGRGQVKPPRRTSQNFPAL